MSNIQGKKAIMQPVFDGSNEILTGQVDSTKTTQVEQTSSLTTNNESFEVHRPTGNEKPTTPKNSNSIKLKVSPHTMVPGQDPTWRGTVKVDYKKGGDVRLTELPTGELRMEHRYFDKATDTEVVDEVLFSLNELSRVEIEGSFAEEAQIWDDVHESLPTELKRRIRLSSTPHKDDTEAKLDMQMLLGRGYEVRPDGSVRDLAPNERSYGYGPSRGGGYGPDDEY